MTDAVHAVLSQYQSRLKNVAERPEGSLPVEALLYAYPIAEEGSSTTGEVQ